MSDFKKLYEEYSKPLYRFLLSLTKDSDAAEDLMQETFYRALLNIDKFEGKSSIYTWLCSIGKNAWIKEAVKKKRYIFKPIDELCGERAKEPTPEEQMIYKEEYRKIRKAIIGLNDTYRDVFILHAYAEVKLVEIARLYEKTESWARVTYYRARQQIIQEVTK